MDVVYFPTTKGVGEKHNIGTVYAVLMVRQFHKCSSFFSRCQSYAGRRSLLDVMGRYAFQNVLSGGLELESIKLILPMVDASRGCCIPSDVYRRGIHRCLCCKAASSGRPCVSLLQDYRHKPCFGDSGSTLAFWFCSSWKDIR